MGSFPECRCMICYYEAESLIFTAKTATADYELECPQCLNNDREYIEKIETRELVTV
jgi:hypothetical protein